MLAVIVGYPGSQKVVPASKWLAKKYLPDEWSRIYLNYTGEINGWADYLSDFLKQIDDDYIVLALDDYLISDYFDFDSVSSQLWPIKQDPFVCIKLCQSTEEEHKEYPVTTQYCLWDRNYLINLLSHPSIKSPWQFEINGSKIFDKVCLHRPCLKYFTNSSISSRWEGVRLDGLKEEDIKYITENKLIQ